jgi:hypothetical protein
MKHLLITVFGLTLMISCNNATDGNPNTDTTKLMIDTGGINGDSANHINTNTGEYPKDTAMPGKTDIRSSNPTNEGSRSTTPGNDTNKRRY